MAPTKTGNAQRIEEDEISPAPASAPQPEESAADTISPVAPDAPDAQTLDDLFGVLKSLLGAVEKLQKARQDVGDIKPLLVRILDGELLSGEELEQVKSGVNGLSRLVRSYDDYQTTLKKAQPARSLLDQVMKS